MQLQVVADAKFQYSWSLTLDVASLAKVGLSELAQGKKWSVKTASDSIPRHQPGNHEALKLSSLKSRGPSFAAEKPHEALGSIRQNPLHPS